jgi:hypothetical protein
MEVVPAAFDRIACTLEEGADSSDLKFGEFFHPTLALGHRHS